MTDVGTIVRTTDPILDEGDHEKLTHIVAPASAYWEAVVNGVPCTALCGKCFLPSRDPKLYDKCKTCVEVLDEMVARRRDL